MCKSTWAKLCNFSAGKRLSRLSLVFLLSSSPLVQAEGLKDEIENKSFSEILSHSTGLKSSDIPLAKSLLWTKYQATLRADRERSDAFQNKALKFGDKTMRFSMATRGNKPAQGYPLYIALHGGGAAGSAVNDSQWQDMQNYYRDSVSTGIYVATRGVTDTWNLHFVDESYPLYDELIEMMIASGDVDPNRVYLLGFSAGGDGVYQITPRMPDRFAAANMSAGHHNWIKFDNLHQTPFLIQVGENDSAYSRNTVAVENHRELDRLRDGNPDGYVHDVFVHAGGSHNSWRDNDSSGSPHTILSRPIDWLQNQNHDTTARDTNAIHWLDKFTRNPYPQHLIWDPKTSAPRSQKPGGKYLTGTPNALSQPKNLYYWLETQSSDLRAETIRIDARYDKGSNSLTIKGIDPIESLKILLRSEMLDLTKPIHLTVDGVRQNDIQVSPDLSVMARTLLERGDPSYMFEAEVVLKKAANFWYVLAKKNPSNYSYCSKDSCRTISGPAAFFFGQLPLTVATRCEEPNTYAMTFDDGPSDNYPAVLETLARNEVRATFFVLGNHLSDPRYTDFLSSASKAGHQISNHTFTHRDLMQLSDEELVKELEDTKTTIIQVLGNEEKIAREASIVRPPFGYITAREENLLAAHGYRSVRWNSDRYDWELGEDGKDTELQRLDQHLSFVKSQAITNYNNSILDLNHDFSPATLSNLETMIQTIKSAGYRFVTVSECLGL